MRADESRMSTTADLAAIRALLRQLTAAVDALDAQLQQPVVAPAPAKPAKLFDPTEAAELLGLSRPTIYRLMAAGELEWVQIGARRRITAAAIDKIITNHTAEASA
jgi:excisionase family DNA binding protein